MITRKWVIRRVLAVVIILPAWAANYAVIGVLQYFLNLEHLWILSLVAIGDIVGLVINILLVDKYMGVLSRFKDAK